MPKRQSYSEALAKDRDKYLRERNLLARTLENILSLYERGAVNDNAARHARQIIITIFGKEE